MKNRRDNMNDRAMTTNYKSVRLPDDRLVGKVRADPEVVTRAVTSDEVTRSHQDDEEEEKRPTRKGYNAQQQVRRK